MKLVFLKYYNIDAAILFSDILLLPHFLGQKVTFKKKIGPVLKKINIDEKFLKKDLDINDFKPIKNAILEDNFSENPELGLLISGKRKIVSWMLRSWAQEFNMYL